MCVCVCVCVCVSCVSVPSKGHVVVPKLTTTKEVEGKKLTPVIVKGTAPAVVTSAEMDAIAGRA